MSAALNRFVELLETAGCAPQLRDEERGRARCPAHDDRRPSLNFRVGRRAPLIAHCFPCGAKLPAILDALGASAADRKLILGHDAGTPRAPKPRVAKLIPANDYPPRDEVAALWNAADSDIMRHADVLAWIRHRGFDPSAIEFWDLARVARNRDELPPWAAKFWPRHRLIVPLFDATGAMRSVQGRNLTIGECDPKTRFPEGRKAGGLVFADGAGQWVLREREVPRGGLWIGEGLPDYLKLASTWSDGDETAPAILALPGSGAWCSELAARIPSGTRIVICVHHDAAGEAYLQQIRAELGGRCRLLRWKPRPLPTTSDPGVAS